jgi:hypothetical protein
MSTKIIVIGFMIIAIIGLSFIISPVLIDENDQKITINDFLIYTENYKCMDFSIDMAKNAIDEGFKSGCVTILPKDGSTGHMIVWVDSDDGRQYIEPQTDNIYNDVSDFLINDYHVDPDDYTVIDVSINLAIEALIFCKCFFFSSKINLISSFFSSIK